MIILGVLLLAAAAVAAIELILANHSQFTLHMWRWTWHFDAFWLAVGGAAILAVALLGLSMLKVSGGRARRLRRERRDLTSENRRLAERAEVAESTPAVPAEGHVRPGPSAGTHAAPADSYLHQNDPATAPPAATQPGSTGYVAPAGQRDAGEQSGGRG